MIEVTAAIIERDGKLLIGKRGPGGSCGGLWEFPGGKREPGESLSDCLIRECEEELLTQITVGGICETVLHTYPDKQVSLTFFYAAIKSGEPCPTVHEELRWAEPAELTALSFCPADIGLIKNLAGLYGIKEGLYRHFKGNEYQVLALAKHSETLEPMVVYRPLSSQGFWVRPAGMFSETVERDGKRVPRFSRL